MLWLTLRIWNSSNYSEHIYLQEWRSELYVDAQSYLQHTRRHYSWNNCFNGTRLTVNLTIYRCRAMYVAARRLICGDLMTKQLYASSNVNVRRWITWLLGDKARKSCLCGVSITKKALLFGGWCSINVDRIIKHTIWQTSLENIYRILPLSPDPDINSAGKMARCEIASI